ncbi:MAG TPA: PKD domain-containing protein, partial [Chloroflexota bacterium]|nr:PKD domain-containing protein [Chloroflexota bacterium]
MVHSTAAISVVSPLAISLVLNTSTVSTGQSVTATLTATSGTVTSSSIDWGDGSTSAGPSAPHTYASAGIYTITGTASDATGTVVRPTTTVNVLPPLATSLTLSAATIAAGNSVTATLAASSGTISSSSIQWGDGSSSNGPAATHVYQSPGSYSIAATASDTAGAVAQASAALTVVSPLITSLVLNASTIEAGNGITATISATSGTVTSSSVDWGDGSSSVGPTAAHTYSSPGTYTVTATVSDATGAVVHPSATLAVVAPLAASLTLNTSTIDAGQSVIATLTATSGSTASSSIDWGDGNSSNGPSA